MNHWVLIIGWLIAAFGITHNWRRMLASLSELGRAQKRDINLGGLQLLRRENFTQTGWRHRNLVFLFAAFWMVLGIVWMILTVRAPSA